MAHRPRVRILFALAFAVLVATFASFTGIAPNAYADCAIGSDCFEIEPAEGSPGTTVLITSTRTADCHELADHPRPWLQFYRGSIGVGYGASTEMFPAAEGSWTTSVPASLTNGRWKLLTYCIGDGPIRTTPTGAIFTVTGAPETSTVAIGKPQPRDPGGTVGVMLVLATGLVTFVLMLHRRWVA
jgi:hypothetical protein